MAEDSTPRRPEDGRRAGGRRRRERRAAGARAGAADAVRGARRRSSRSPAPISSSRCGASTASAATTRRTPARWAPTRTREPPFFFQKPTDAIQIAPPGETIDHPYPTLTKNYHYEVELVAALDKGGRNVPIERALELVYGYTVGPRHDAARPAARDGRREEAVGDRQELRPLGACSGRCSRSRRSATSRRGRSGSRSTARRSRTRTSTR